MLLLDRRILDSNKDMASKHLALYNIRPRRVLLHNKSKRGIQFPDGGHTWPLHNQKQPNLSPGDETCQCQDQHIRKDCLKIKLKGLHKFYFDDFIGDESYQYEENF